MTNLKKLSREDLRNVSGGRGCSIAVKQTNGTWVTYTGSCKTVNNTFTIFGYNTNISIGHSTTSYCDAGFGNVSLSSNGGSSHCND